MCVEEVVSFDNAPKVIHSDIDCEMETGRGINSLVELRGYYL